MGKKKGKGKGKKQPQEADIAPSDVPHEVVTTPEEVLASEKEKKNEAEGITPPTLLPQEYESEIKKDETADEGAIGGESIGAKKKKKKQKQQEKHEAPKEIPAAEPELQKNQMEAKLKEIPYEMPAKLETDTGTRPKSVFTEGGIGRGRGRGRGKVSSPELEIPGAAIQRGIGKGRGKELGHKKILEEGAGEPRIKELKSPEKTVPPITATFEVKETKEEKKEIQPSKPSQLKKGQSKKESPLETVVQIKQALPQDTGLLPPKRKTFGKEGRVISLRANHFQVKFDPKRIIHHYDINIKPDINTMKSLKRRVVAEMIKLYPKIFGITKCVFDGEKNMYSNMDLQLRRDGNTFEVKWKENEKEKRFHVDIKKVAEVKLHDLQEFLEGRIRIVNQTAIQALDIVMRHLSSMRYVTIGRSVFPSQANTHDLGGGAEMWRGFYQSLRPGEWKHLQLNLDVSNRSFYKEQSVLEFICELCQIRYEEIRKWNMSSTEREKITKEIKGLRVEVTHTTIKRTYKIIGLSSKPAEYQTFPLTTDAGTQLCTVGKYFLDTYRKSLTFPNLPCLQAQPADKHRYLPMEVCRIPGGQQCKKLTDVQTANMIRAAAAPAYIRERDIRNMVKTVNFQRDEFVRDFGLSFNDSLMQVQGRILPPPEIQMKNNFKIEPKIGVWDMRSKQFHDPVSIRSWGMLLFVDKRRFGSECIQNFVREMMTTGRNVGIEISQPRFQEYCRGVDDVSPVFRHIQETCKDLQLILVILPGKTPIYAEVKRCGDNIAGISTQCVQMKNASRPNPATFTNIFMKINAKLGGTNSIIHCRPVSSSIFKEPVIILGADVTHPPAGDKSKPSIAAIIGSLDKHAVKYKAKICVQEHRVETIMALKDKVKDLLLAFYKAARAKPQRIIFYRDGVGEGQFYEILSKELIAIRQACQSLEQEYKPKITFLVVQKRHHTRLFCDDVNDAIGKSKNVPPGTTVDRAIVHPIENDFYLCSHQGIQGTSRPTHYHVLWDDSDFTADELQQLTFELCHTYVRCTRSVSIPAPAYYAHLAAFRARHHLENLQRECDKRGGDPNEWLQKMQKAVEINDKLGDMYFA